jgi:putative FmdB family regulatory protein
MPTYDYRCESCGHELEVFQRISESPKRKCPRCKKSKLRRKIGGGAGFLFKGSGFYLTDYRSDSYKKSAEADRKVDSGGEAKPAAGDTTPPAKKPAPEKKSEKKKGKESAA